MARQASKKCPNCGEKVKDIDLYCENCGMKFLFEENNEQQDDSSANKEEKAEENKEDKGNKEEALGWYIAYNLKVQGLKETNLKDAMKDFATSFFDNLKLTASGLFGGG